MPELAEVCLMTRYLRDKAQVIDSRIVGVDIPKRYNYFNDKAQVPERLVGKVIRRITRKAKYQLIYLQDVVTGSDDGILLVHNKFTGLLENPAHPWTFNYVEYERKTGNEKDIRITFRLHDGERLVFHDARCLGDVNFYPTTNPREIKKLMTMGPDVLHTDTLDEAFRQDVVTAESLGKELARHKQDVKAVLLNQKFQAGIGNIYVCEALWECGIHPLARACDVVDRADDLLKAVRDRMTQSMDSTIDYLNVLKVFKVRKRAMVCPRCQGKIERMEQANRGTYWCPREQTIGAPSGS